MSEGILFHTSHMTCEHSDWLRGIAFYIQELQILRKRLVEVSSKNTRQDVKAEIEHYQNAFTVQEKNLIDLAASIRAHESLIARNVRELSDHLGNSTLAQHDVLRESFIALEKTVNEFRHTFNRFLAKWM